jgi:UDP-N-acetylglucosamine 2-epimerase (non-hydrolysing)
MLICNVVGARPNYMKIAPVVLEMKKRGMSQILVHTGQHYDQNMSKVFFEELGMPEPDVFLKVGSGSHAVQTAKTMIAFEEVCRQRRPDLVVVGGDVNSTLAAGIVSAKECIPLAHIEAGLRSFDRSMPEEINRILTDQLSELLFTTEETADENLVREGIPAGRIYFVGNCMIDTLMKYVDKAISLGPWRAHKVRPGGYALLTLHRPSNVDELGSLKLLIDGINEVSSRIPIIFPVHPRTREQLRVQGLRLSSSVHLCEPLPYLTFLGLMAKAKVVMTDSGGIQEETTALRVPCLTLRRNTERPVTVTSGTNRLVGMDSECLLRSVEEILNDQWTEGTLPPFWDGRASCRIVDVIEGWLQGSMQAG